MEVKAMKQAITLKGATLKDATPKDTTLKDTTLKEAESCIYEKVYFALWEMGQRYSEFVQFRVIGRSHDDRMIPMFEIGKGERCIFCVSGLEGGDGELPQYLLQAAKEYCQFYECGWIMGENYEVKKLLDRVKICFVPIVNPDAYEIAAYGYGAIRNPIYRQMLKMQDRPTEGFPCNARGIELKQNFPTNYYQRQKIHQEPASENETRALIGIFQEYKSAGLLTFGYSHGKIIDSRQEKGFAYNQRNYRLARYLQKCSGYRLEKGKTASGGLGSKGNNPDMGSPEQFYAEVIRQPSLAIEIPVSHRDIMKEIRQLPLEYIYSL